MNRYWNKSLHLNRARLGAAHNRGQSLVEFALIIPILLLAVVVILDLGRAVYYYSVIYNAAREGARFGIVQPGNAAGIEAAARELAIGLDQAELTVTSNWDQANEAVEVVVTYNFTAITPFVTQFLGGDTIAIDSQATMTVEGVMPP
jgi:Flp pilus assembly protein TadG